MKNIKFLAIFLAIVAIFSVVKVSSTQAKDSDRSVGVNIKIDDDNDDDSDKDEDRDEDRDNDDDKDDDSSRGKGSDSKEDDDNDERRGFFGRSGRESDDHNDDFWSGVVGKVTAINENTLTVSAMTPWNKDSKTTVYTVDATNAEIEKEGADNETISDVTVGDMVIVEGTVTGTNVVAKEVKIGLFKAKWEGVKDSFVASSDPVVGGTVTAVTDTTITMKNKDSVTYTIDADSAKIVRKGFETSVLSDIKIDDNILVQGVITNTSIDAKLIIDTAVKIDSEGNMSGDKGEHRGFFKKMGIFFKGWFARK